MKFVNLGNTGLNVSRLCFGSLAIGPLHHNLSIEEGAEVILEALHSGINFIDTAQLYKTYPYIKRAVKLFGKEVHVASKTFAYSKETAISAVEEARRELDMDVLSVFLLHEQESEHTLRGHKEALDELYRYKALGVIKAVGISTHFVQGVYAAIDAGLDVVHPLINIDGLGIADGTRKDMEAAITKASRQGMGAYTMKAFGGGNLINKRAEALEYALQWGDSLAVGMRDINDVRDNIHFFEQGFFVDKKYFFNDRKLYIEPHCTGCGECTSLCGSKALTISSGQAVCDHKRCVLCGYCSTICQDFCIKII